MKKLFTPLWMLALILFMFSCKKDKAITSTDNYTSMDNFYSSNESPMQTYTIDGATGGSFTTPQNTVVKIPAFAFKTPSGDSVNGPVTISFKDVYKKSDMLLNQLSTNLSDGRPMKSAGMFYIKAEKGGQALYMAHGKSIRVTQPLNGVALDPNMRAYVIRKDSANVWSNPWIGGNGSSIVLYGNLVDTINGYFYNLSQFTPPLGNGTWCNSDNPSFFAAYPQTTLTLVPKESIADYSMQLYLFFNTVNCAVHIWDNDTDFSYIYAPVGLQCTAVAFGVKDGKLYSCFTLLTINTNLHVNFSLSETTTADFMAQLNALN
ncbi:MAG: hypothetical protein WCL06_12350 [Bacteroidota bacterium]